MRTWSALRLFFNTAGFRWGATFLVGIILLVQLRNEILHSDFQFNVSAFRQPPWWLAVALLPVNYFLETFKWRLLIVSFYPNVSFSACLKAVLVGTSLGLFTPNRIGEYVGRLGALGTEYRYEAATATLWNRLTQLIATLFFGIGGLLYFVSQGDTFRYELFGGVLLLGSSLLGTALFFFIRPQSWATLVHRLEELNTVRYFFKRFPFLKRVFNGAVTIRRDKVLISVGLALMRYLVFATQYVCLLFAFGVQAETITVFSLVGLIFLLKSFVPSVALAELGIREAIAIYVFSLIHVAVLPVVQATFTLYVLNLFLPALLGTFWMPQWMRKSKR